MPDPTTDQWAQAAAEYKQQAAPPGATPKSPPPATDPWMSAAAEYKRQQQPPSLLSQAGTVAGSMVRRTLSDASPLTMVSGGLQMLRHPIETGKEVLGEMSSVRQRASKEAKQGDMASAVKHEVLGLIPVLGPTFAHVEDALDQLGTIKDKNSPEYNSALKAAGSEAADLLSVKTVPQIYHGLGAIKSRYGPAVSDSIARSIKFKTKLTPEERAAVLELQRRGHPVSVGQQTGHHFVRKGEDILQYMPGASGPAQRFFDTQRAGINKELHALPDKESPAFNQVTSQSGHVQSIRQTANPTDTGRAIVERIQDDRMASLKGYADKQYNSVRSQLEHHQATTQKAAYQKAKAKWEKEHAAGLQKPLNEQNANPFTGEIPDDAPEPPRKPKFAAEVKMASIRDDLRPLRDELAGSLTETKKANSPGWTVLNRIVEGKEDVSDALVVDKDLGAIKSMLRRNEGQPMTPSDRYATRVLSKLEAGLEKSLSDVNPSLVNRLKAGRRAVKEYHRSQDLINRLIPPGETPIRVYQNLTSKTGRQLERVREVKRIAPNQIALLGNTLLDGIIRKSVAEGGVNRAGSMFNNWNDIDRSVREEIFGKKHTESIDRVLMGVKHLGIDENPSSTARSRAVFIAIETGLGAAGSAMFGYPLALLGVAGKAASLNILSRVLFSPRGAKLLAESLEAPFGSKAQRTAMAGVRQITIQSQPKKGTPYAPPQTTPVPPSSQQSPPMPGPAPNAPPTH